MIISGLDEAGYGPRLGPLVLATASFDTPHAVDLADALAPEVGRAGSKTALVHIDDSKALHSGRHKLARLETTVLAAVAVSASGSRPPDHMGGLLEALGAPPASDLPPWYNELADLPLPQAASSQAIATAAEAFSQALGRAHLGGPHLHASVLCAPELNRRIHRTGNKARAHWSSFGELVRAVLGIDPKAAVHLTSDRHGGRAYYGDLIAELLPMVPLDILEESPKVSRYRVRPQGRDAMEMGFEVKADARHLHVALASCVAKYVREIHLVSLNAWFTQRIPGLRPTAGYAADANRYLDTVRPFLEEQRISLETLVRAR